MTLPDLSPGDVIQLQGPTVPRDLWDKWFQVQTVSRVKVMLGRPYHDKELTRRYRPRRTKN